LSCVEEVEHTPRSGWLRGLRVAVVGLGSAGLPTALSFAGQEPEVSLPGIHDGRLAAIMDNLVELLPRDQARLDDTATAGVMQEAKP
jgi:UDP-N-acetyl-D-mannosaminuronate dehydrogenase